MGRKALVSSLLVSILASFMAWAVIWTLQDSAETVRGVGDDAVALSILNVGTGERADATSNGSVGRLADLLSRYGVAAIMDGNEDGHPVLWALDSEGIVPWLSQYAGKLVPSDRPQVILFKGSYSEGRWEAGLPLTLLPEGSDVIDTINPTHDNNGTLQGVCVPSRQSRLIPGTYVLSSMPKGLLDELRPLLLSTDLELGGLEERPLWLDLVSSPMFVIASFLLVFGLMSTGVFWRVSATGRRDDIRLVYLAGGTARTMVRRDFVGCMVPILVGVLGGAAASAVLTGAVSQAPPPEGLLECLCLTTGLSALVLLVLMYLVLRWAIVSALRGCD